MEENKVLIRKSPLLKKVHDMHNGIRFKDDAVELLQDQIELITEIICSLAVENVHKNNRKTIMTIDINSAFDEFMENKTEIDNLIKIFEMGIEQINAIKHKSISKRFLGDEK